MIVPIEKTCFQLSYFTIEKEIYQHYCQISDTGHTLIGNEIVDHSDVVWALIVGTAPTTSLKHSTIIFIQENSFEYTICKMATILVKPQCFNPLYPNDPI